MIARKDFKRIAYCPIYASGEYGNMLYDKNGNPLDNANISEF